MKYSILILLLYFTANFVASQTSIDSISKISMEIDSIASSLISDAIKHKKNILIARQKTSSKFPPKLTVMYQVDSCSYLYRIEVNENYTLSYINIQDRAERKFGCSNKFTELEKFIDGFIQESKDFQYKESGYTIVGYVNQKFVYQSAPINFMNQRKPGILYHIMSSFLAL